MSPLVHPEQDEPFNDKSRDLLAQHLEIGKILAMSRIKDVDNWIKVDEACENVDKHGIHCNDRLRQINPPG
jgi:hypothetical protein